MAPSNPPATTSTATPHPPARRTGREPAADAILPPEAGLSRPWRAALWAAVGLVLAAGLFLPDLNYSDAPSTP